MVVISVTRNMIVEARRQLTVTARMPTTREGLKHQFGPPQPPLEELHGETITAELVGDMNRNQFGEDEYSKDERVAAAKWLIEAYEINRHRPVYPRIWQEPGLYLLSGNMGGGKTMVCGNIGVIFMMSGWPPYSTAGFLFGKRFDEAQTFAFPNFITPGCMVFADELHAIYGRYTGASIRGQTMAQATASFRKQKIYCFGTSAREWMLAPDIKASVLGLGYPRRSTPDGPPTAPPWAYRAIRWYYPDPWGGRELREQFGESNPQKCQKWTEYPHSYDLTRAAKHFDSWEKIKLDFGGGMGATEFRGRMSGTTPLKTLSPEAIGLTILEWVQDGDFEAQEEAHLEQIYSGKGADKGATQVDLSVIRGMFKKRGYKASVESIRQGLIAFECRPTQRRVQIKDLTDALHRAQQEGTYDPEMLAEEDE